MRVLVRLAILGFAAYGAKTMYDRNRDKFHDLGEPLRELSSRTKNAVDDAAWHTADAANEAVNASRGVAEEALSASKDAAAEVRAAARDAANEVAQRSTSSS